MRKVNQKGFTLVEGMLVVIALALVIFVGFYVWHAQKDTNKTLDTASKTIQKSSSQATKSSPKTDTVKTINPADAVIYKDDTGMLYQISLLASTAEQQALATAVDAYCKTEGGTANFVGGTGVADFFSNTQNATITSNSASLNMTCYDKSSKDTPWGNAARYQFAKEGGSWKFVSAGQGQ